MVNLNECKFGDRLRTRGGFMGVYLRKSFIDHDVHYCVFKNNDKSIIEIAFHGDGTRYYDNDKSKYDIVGKWEDEE